MDCSLEMSLNQNGISSHFSSHFSSQNTSQNSSQQFSIELPPSRSRKKLLPTSSPPTFRSSTMVKAPRPGSTRLFSSSHPVAVARTRHTEAASRLRCPWSPHSRSCLSYLLDFSELVASGEEGSDADDDDTAKCGDGVEDVIAIGDG